MNPSQQQPMSTTTATTTTPSKVRLMLSYGGQILPRPNNFNSLYYCGGDTRILAVDRRVTNTIAAFISHISSSVKINQPFVVKYQLPNHDLDSLISVTNDDDLFILFDEYDRIAGAASSRLRLFLFPLKQQQQQQRLQQQKHHQFDTAPATANNLLNSPPDSWFSDTLKSAKIMRRKDACLEDKSLGSLQESVVLETSSSFGSSSSSGSSTNAPSTGLQETLLKLPQPDPLLSNIDPASGVSHTKIGVIQDPIVDVATITSGITSPHDELRSNLPSAYSPQVYTPVPFSGYPMNAQLPQQPLPSQQQQPQQQQQMQFVQANSQYTYYPTGPLPICSNSPVYSQLPPYQTQYRPNQGYPFYLLPISQTQPFNSSVQSNLIDTGVTTTTAPTTASQPLMCSNVAIAPPQMSYNDVAVVQPAAEYASKVYKANPVVIPVPITSTQNQVQLAAVQPLPHVPQSVAIPLVEATSKFSNVADDPAYDLIYKTQPSAPTMPSQFQTTTVPTTALLLPEELAKLHVNEASQQLRV